MPVYKKKGISDISKKVPIWYVIIIQYYIQNNDGTISDKCK